MKSAETASRLDRLVAASTLDWECLEDADGRMLWVSPACEPISGHSPEELLNDPGLLHSIVHPEDRALFESHRSECRLADDRDEVEFRIVRPDGGVRRIGHRCGPIILSGGTPAGRRSSNCEITQRNKTEGKLLRLNRTFQALGNSNQVLTGARTESELLEDVCRIVVEDCGHAMVWIGYAEEDERKTVRPVAHAGFDRGYLDALNVTWADTERGRGATGTAIRTGRPAACRNMLTDPGFAPWREEALRRGYASSIVFPLKAGGKAFGAINITSKEPDPFPDDEVKLLAELADDLSFGIASIRGRMAQAAAEKALRESELRYRTLFESMDEGFAACEMIYDEAGKPSDFRYLSVNPAFARLTGLPLARVVGHTVRELIPGLEPSWTEAYGRVVQSGQSERLENRVTELGKHFEVYAWRSGPDRFAVVFDDVTERKQVETKLKWLASFPGRNPLPVVEADPDGQVHYANPAATALFPDLDDPRLPHPWIADWEEAVRRLGESGAGTFSREVAVGKRRFEQTLSLVTESNRIRIYGTEITERKRAEAALEAARLEAVSQKNRLEAVMEALPVGVGILDEKGGNVRSNSAFEKIWGGPRPPIRTIDDYSAYKAWWAESGEPLRPEEWASAIAVREGRAVVGQRVQIERFDGARAFVLNSAAPVVGSDGRVAGSAVAIVDITEARRTEERLRELNDRLEESVAERTAELEKRSAQLRALAAELTQAELRERRRLAGLLHDHLQQILAAARLNLDALPGRTGNDDIHAEVTQIAELLDQSIAECRSLTVGLSPPVLEDAGLAGALRWLVRRVQEQHGLHADLSLSADHVEPADPDVRGFMFEAVRELLFNVVKHSGVMEAKIAMTRAGDEVQVRVEDKGRGLDREALRDRRGDAAGFGLFSIQQRLELVGGSMAIESVPGRGTCITLRAPAGPRSEKAASGVSVPAAARGQGGPAPSPTPAAGGVIRVVLADDHRILRQGLIALLKAEPDIDVVGEAADGAEAVELARSVRPDVIVMDVTMPKMSGIEATRRIVSEIPGVKIIGLSMHEDEEIAAAMREAGARDFVTKGGRSDVLISSIHAAAQSDREGK